MNIREYINKLLLETEDNYANYNTSIIALSRNKKILILQRGSTAPWMPNKWSIVGGVVDDGEDFKTAVVRETIEEIGQTPKNVQYINKIKTPDSGNIIYFTGSLDFEDVHLDYENQDYKFITQNELSNYQFVPYVVDFLENCFAKL
jgi:8-oxo-dGTP pyrophosphatase MutT (NUDIX family)